MLDAKLAQPQFGFADETQQRARQALILGKITQQELIALQVAEQRFAFVFHGCNACVPRPSVP